VKQQVCGAEMPTLFSANTVAQSEAKIAKISEDNCFTENAFWRKNAEQSALTSENPMSRFCR
jgi:hypothetical protein